MYGNTLKRRLKILKSPAGDFKKTRVENKKLTAGNFLFQRGFKAQKNRLQWGGLHVWRLELTRGYFLFDKAPLR